ncbi:MAG: LarC family nickel insertion protein [Actinomycetes bacterium]
MHAWFDISAGVAGDMLLGALLDAGADPEAVVAAVEQVAPGSIQLGTTTVTRGGQRATKAQVDVLVEDPPHRSWATIRQALETLPLHAQTRAWSLAAFGRLADAEARVHGVPPDTVHFHEVGALDSIADVVGTCEALRSLGVTSVSASAVRLGSGRVRAAHGDLPVPVPAVAELVRGWQVYATPEWNGAGDVDDHPHAPREKHEHEHEHEHENDHAPHVHRHAPHDSPAERTTIGTVGELATPTGLALVRALAQACEPLPALAVASVGIGAGGRDVAGWPNIVRVVLGEHAGSAGAADRPPTELSELMANVDDLDPRLWPGVLDALLATGAVDAWLVPIQMKKGRPAFTVHALADPRSRPAVIKTLLEHTTTLGVREVGLTRTVAQRSWVDVDLDGHPLTVKIGARDGTILHAAAEFDALAALAASLGRPQAELAQRAASAIVVAGLTPGSPVPSSARPTRG